MDLNAIHYPDIPPVPLNTTEHTLTNLVEEYAKTSTTYRVHVQFVTSLSRILPNVVTVDSAAGLSLDYEETLPGYMLELVKTCAGTFLLCVSNNRVASSAQIRLFLLINDLIVPFHFGVMKNLPPKLLIEEIFCCRNVKTIDPASKRITPPNYPPLPILDFNDDTISEIHSRQSLTAHHTMKDDVNLRLNNPIEIKPYSQRLVTVSATVDGLGTLENRPSLYHSRKFHLTNGIVHIEDDKSFQFWVINMSNKP